MPSSARKSSLGTSRRALQKAHIPYRGDNPEVGKKTGIAVQHVQRMSDGFEPFEEVLQQADGRTPPRPRGPKKSSVVRYDDDEDDDEDEQYDEDEYGEMSMQLDSPVQQNLASMRAPTTPTTNGRPSSRPVARSSNVDFDKIPSPRPRNAANAGPGPSRLSRSYVARAPISSPQDDDDDNDDTMQMDGGFDDDFGPQEGGESSPRRTNFSQIDQDDDDDDENEPFQDDPPPEDDRRSETPKQKQDKGKNKGKNRAREEDSADEQMEDDIARGLDDISNGQQSDQDQDPTPRPKKVKIAEQEKPRSKTQTQTRTQKENREYRDGLRRSAREHYAPLEYWRGEKVVYGRDRLVPSITEIIRIPKEPPAPLGKRKRGRGRSRSRSRAPSSKTGGGAGAGAVGAGAVGAAANLEEGWDDDTPSNAKVLDYRTGQEVERRIAWTARMVNPQPVANNSWSFDKIFGDADFIAAGQLVIPPKSRKPSKATKDNTYIFYVVEGAVNLKVHETSMVLSTGGMFMVPRVGNTYFIENISQRDARLFFTQARKTMNDEDERMIALANRPKKLRRSSSAGAMRPGGGTGGRSSVPPPNSNSDGTPLTSRAASTRA
ncbi:Mif2/CENP-C like-domain-containing protein [Ephemerocybe angulata]|uniref:CENP-C homolog n=1 Tax=Ephemerocybe angulata TaxID=980116 RepID=A0A8H6IDK3_9AGAR|nr:Mif2/CENP-C like-domain-containing protein [Tulosesus angulatus]